MNQKQDGRSPSTRERILDVSLRLFSEQGYDKTSLREVAENVGVTKAALYYHFPSKESVLSALLEQAHVLGAHGVIFFPTAEIARDPGRLAAFALRAIDTVLSQRSVFLLMERNRAAIAALPLPDQDHGDLHRQMEERWSALLGDSAIPLRQRVRFASALGAVMATAMGSLRGLGDAGLPALRQELALAVMDILEIPASSRPPLQESIGES